MSIKLPVRLRTWHGVDIEDADGTWVAGTRSTKKAEELVALLNANYDPTPWCNACGARTKLGCLCPPIAENE